MGRPRKATTDVKEQNHLALVRKASAARNAAFKRMKQAFPDEWDQFYAEEAAKVGVTPMATRYKKKREELLAELAKLDALEKKRAGRTAPAPAARKTAVKRRGK